MFQLIFFNPFHLVSIHLSYFILFNFGGKKFLAGNQVFQDWLSLILLAENALESSHVVKIYTLEV